MIPLLARGKMSAADWRRPSVIALIVANVMPVFGVLLLGWEILPVIFLFWSENIVIGAFNVLKMLIASPGSGIGVAGKFFLIPFFCVHYGLFTFVHGVFVLTLFGDKQHHPKGAPSLTLFWDVIREYHLGWAALGLVVSHGISFATNFIRNGEYRKTNVGQLMAQPYGRILVLHVALLLGGALMHALHSPMAGLLILIALKVALDLRAHLAERMKFENKSARTENAAKT